MSFSIDEDMWFGESTDSVAEEKAKVALARIIDHLSSILRFPHTAARLMAIDENFTVREVTGIINGDPALAAAVLKAVNSPAMGLRRPCASLQDAVGLLGSDFIRGIAAAHAVLNMMPGLASHGEQIRRQSTQVAGLARIIANQRNNISTGEVFTCALLHDVGKLFLLKAFTKPYSKLLDDHIDTWDQLHLAERRIFGYDHAVVAGHLLKKWGLPETINTTVAWHHQSGRALREGGRVGGLVSAIRLADHALHLLEAGVDEDSDLIDQLANSSAASWLGLSAADLRREWENFGRCRLATT